MLSHVDCWNILGYSGCHCPLGVCKPCSASGWVAITFPGILVVGKVSPGCIGCAGENPGDEQHVVFECPGLQDIRDGYQGLFGEHATTMLQFMWQDDIRGVAMFIKECLGVYYGTDPYGGQASRNDQP